MNFRGISNTGLRFRGNRINCDRNLLKFLHFCFSFCFVSASEQRLPSFMLETCGFWLVSLTSRCWCVCLLHELMCNNSYHFPLCLGWHAGVAVHQRLGRLWERVGDAVTETLAQTSSARRTEYIIFIVPRHGVRDSTARRSCLRKEEELRMPGSLRPNTQSRNRYFLFIHESAVNLWL